MKELLKKAFAECIGTFVLVFVACGVAGATGGSLVATSLAFGLTIVAMAYSVGRISGCHVNPAGSLGCLLTKRMTAEEFVVYVMSQIVGGFLGALLVFGLFVGPLVQKGFKPSPLKPATGGSRLVLAFGGGLLLQKGSGLGRRHNVVGAEFVKVYGKRNFWNVAVVKPVGRDKVFSRPFSKGLAVL